MIDDATIKRVAQSFIADGCIKQCKQWGMGYEKDENGEYIKPVVPALIYEFARAIEQLAKQEQREEIIAQGPTAHIHRTGSNIIECIFGGAALPTDGNRMASEFVDHLPLNRSVALYAIRASGKENGNGDTC